jgi:hypothetical protein
VTNNLLNFKGSGLPIPSKGSLLMAQIDKLIDFLEYLLIRFLPIEIIFP